MSGSFPNLISYMALVEIQTLSYKELIRQDFYIFEKINLQNFSITRNKINSSSDLLISYQSITQTQLKHMLPTSFKFRVNSYIKAVLSKTQENSRLKTRYLKEITKEQLFIIFILRDYSEFSLFYSTLKNKLKQTRHIFLFCFQFYQIAHYYYK